MKKRILTGFAVLVLAIAMVTACGGGGGGTSSGKTQEKLDTNVNLTVPTAPSDISNFASSKGYTAITQANADSYYVELKDALEEALAEINTELKNGGIENFFSVNLLNNSSVVKSSVSSRAIQSETIEGNLVDLAGADLPPNTKVGGYVKGTFSYNDNEENPFPIKGSGESKFRIELLPGYAEEGFEALGVVTGSVTASNINITSETSMSGSLSGTVKYAVNLAETSSKTWAKCIADVTLSTNLVAQTVSATVNLKIYGDGATPLITDTIKLTATPTEVKVQ
jgi:hypothetical protein